MMHDVVKTDERKPNEIRLDKIIVELQKLNKSTEIIGQVLLNALNRPIIDKKSVDKTAKVK